MILLNKFIMRNMYNMWAFYWSSRAKYFVDIIKYHYNGSLFESFYQNQKKFKTHYLEASKNWVYMRNNKSLKCTIYIEYHGYICINADEDNLISTLFISYQGEELKKVMSNIKSCYRKFLLS